ncbi:TAP42-like protein [Syncephalis fuscata]|nr:TAP42-like protein [Syncephalis fuscata]
MSVADQFRQGQALSLSSGDAQFQAQLGQAIERFEACARDVQSLSLFSDNETLDDLSTSYLRFLLLDAYLAELVMKRTNTNSGGDSHGGSGATQRQAILDTVTQHLRKFLNLCDNYSLISNNYIERIMQGVLHTSGSKEADKSEVIISAARKREEKIERYKREKVMKEKIDASELQRQLEQAKEDVDADTDELDRSLILTLIQLFIQKSSEHLQSIQQEREMLKMMLSREQESQHKKSDSQLDTRTPSSLTNAQGPLLSSTGQPLRPFVITSQREQILQGVFRPGWRLPTMSIDEYLEQERERGNIIEGGGAESGKKKLIDEDNEEEVDAKTYKDREWDDFKDDNPRGWGNRKAKDSLEGVKNKHD